MMKAQRIVLALTPLLVLGACVDARAPRGPEPPAAGMRWSSGIAIHVIGPLADEVRREDCARAVKQYGGSIDPDAPIEAILFVRRDANQLTIVSHRHGVVFDEQRPEWDMDVLCADAVGHALRAMQSEPSSGPNR